MLGEDVTEMSFDIGGITSQIDYPNLTEYRVGEATFSINDPDGDFAPSNPDNFFVRNNFKQTGYRASVEIKSGYGTLETLFVGELIKIRQGIKPGTIKIECDDLLGRYHDSKVQNFGIDRNFGLYEAREPSSRNGEYPILNAVTPIVDGSVTVYSRRGGEMTQVDELATEGELNPFNYVVNEDNIMTEGAFASSRGVAIGYPQIEMKSPYKSILIEDAIRKLVEHVNGNTPNIEDVTINLDPHFSSNGRIGYELIGDGVNVGTSHPITWQGYVTDAMYEPAQSSSDYDKFLFLYNSPQTSRVRSVIIEYRIDTRKYSVIHIAESDFIQFWGLSKYQDNYYILATTSFDPNIAFDFPYDAIGLGNLNKIIIWKRTADTTEDLVPELSVTKPQIAQFYQLGRAGYESSSNESRVNKVLPESRKGFIADSGDIYYTFVNVVDSTFGVAKVESSGVITEIVIADIDGKANHCGASFSLSGNNILGGLTFRFGTRSKIVGFREAV